MADFTLNIITHTDAGVCCSTTPSTSDAFWLSKSSCAFAVTPRPGLSGVPVEVPDWLVKKHRQLAGDVEFEKAKQSKTKPERKSPMAEQRELSGVLSRNTKRETDKQPEFRGTCMIEGVGYSVSAWVKEGSDGKFFSLAFSVRDALPSAQAKPTAAAPCKTKQFDDEVPF
jgi:hypothetical protein